MTTKDAITALLDEYLLETFEGVYKDEAKADPSFTGYSWEHPKVIRFREVCAALRQAVGKELYPKI